MVMEREADTYSSSEAARILRKSNRRVLQMLETGELEGSKNESGRWRIPQRAVHELLPSEPPKGEGANGTSPETFAAHQEAREAGDGPVEMQLRMEALQRELGRLEVRMELAAEAESTLRESLERERERADVERERAEEFQLEVERLRERLAEATSRTATRDTASETTEGASAKAEHRRERSWWKRFFGFE